MSEVKEREVGLIDYFDGDQMAADAWKGKYAAEGEKTPDDMHKRMAKEFGRIEEKYSKSEKSREPKWQNLSEYGKNRNCLLENDIYNLFKDFKYIIPQGSIMASLGTDKISSLSNCFVIGQPKDSYGGIFEKDQQLAQLMKRRGGVGIDISTLAPKGRPVNNAAKTSTGAVSFMERYSNTTREVAQDGRRGALMITMDIRHPDILDFINIKQDRTKVTGANISVMLRNDFMEAVKKDEDYILRYPCNKKQFGNVNYYDGEYNKLYCDGIGYYKKVKAREIFDAIIHNAWDNAEPGQMFIDNHWNYSPDGVYPQYKGITTNPCGEIFMPEYDACRLMALNLYSFVSNPFTEEALIDYNLLYKVAYEQQRLADDLVDLELEHISKILAKIHSDPEPDYIKKTELELWENIYDTAKASRRTGCGFTALGDMLAALNVKYDSDRAKIIIDKVMRTKMEAELDCTIDLAILRGTFKGWDRNLEYPVSNNNEKLYGNNFYYFITTNFQDQYRRMLNYGRRNVSWSTVAPTGTVSLMAQTTSGLEPLFMPFYMRRKKVNPNDENVRVDFTDQNGDTWQEYPILHPKFKDWIQINFNDDCQGIKDFELKDYFEKSPWYRSIANDIDWIERVEIQNIIQRYTSHSISSTINLPNDVSEDVIHDIYLAAYDKGLKGVTVYRDGCRTGVLISNNEKKDEFSYHDAPKRPEKLKCDIHTTVSKGTKWNVLVGLLDDKPYEVFVVPHFTTITDNLAIAKVKNGRYDLLRNGETYSEDITSEMNDEEEVVTRLVSTSLRHGADITFIVEQLNKSNGDITSFSKAIARVLKKYASEDKMLLRAKCTNCGSTNLRMEEGCIRCNDCGDSKCG